MIGQARLSFAAWAATVLGAFVLIPVFSGPFLIVSAFLCAIVTATGVVLQSWRTPRLLVPLIQLLVLVETISLLFYRDTLKYLVVPWKDTALQFNQQMVDALDGINRYSAPLPPETYFTVFTAGVIALTGLLIHVIAVQLRQASWSGLLLLMMYTVPAATVHGGLSAVWFIPPAFGYILLLSAEGRTRLARWGRRIGGVTTLEANDQIEASAAGQAGRRIGLTVIAFAALLPALLPTLPEGVFGNGLAGGSGGGTGLGGTVSLGTNPMLDMGRNLRRGENTVALTYTGDPTYLRFTALDQFDGQSWSIAPRSSYADVDGTFQPPPGLSLPLDSLEQKKREVRVTKSLRTPWVPVPYPTKSLSINNGKWRYDTAAMDITSSNGRTVAGVRYKVTSYEVNPTDKQLRDAIQTGAPDQNTLEVPQATPSRIRKLAKDLTASAKGNHYLEAAALQKWFRDTGGFVYDTSNDSRSGMRAIEEFLFDNKRGYCEQFATAMALMSRTLGIPARVGIGFLPGKPDGNKHVVRMHDMHAWPELYFEGIGWVRFEPTPAQQTGQAPDWTLPADTNPSDDPTLGLPTEGATSAPSGNPDDPRLKDPEANLPKEDDSAPGATTGWWGGSGPRWGAGALAAIALGMVPWLIRTLVRRRRFSRSPGQASVESLWAEIRDTARDIGLDWSDSATPRQVGAWLVGRLPEDVRPQAIRLARAVEFGRYAGAVPGDVDLRDEAAAVRRALIKGASAGQRWRARLLPRSWRWYLSRGTSEASDLLDQFDLGLARLRSLLIPRRRSTQP